MLGPETVPGTRVHDTPQLSAGKGAGRETLCGAGRKTGNP